MTHQELIESAASYALDALDGDERAQFEAHLAGCPECHTEVAAYREVAGALAHTAPAAVIQRPDALRERILRDARRGDSTLAALVRPEVHVVSLVAAPGQKPALRVFWNQTRQIFVVAAQAMPPVPAGRTCQLWAIRKGKPPMSMGTFAPSPSGRTIALLAVPSEITDGGLIDECALTVEPMGGSPQPTETPRLAGAWRHVD